MMSAAGPSKTAQLHAASAGVGAQPSGPRAASVYVYYRIAEDTPEARATVSALFTAVAAATGVGGRLLVRCDDPRMWMEVYEPVIGAVAFLRRLDALAREHGMAHVSLNGVRNTECFAPLAEPAAHAA
jgi:uncharacterized protein DUF4936